MSLRAQLTGTWHLVSYAAHLPTDHSNIFYPMGPDCQGIIMYTSDGYMSAQLVDTSAAPPPPPSSSSSEEEKTDATKPATAARNAAFPSAANYAGEFHLDEATGDEQGRPVLLHHMRISNLPRLLGDTQRRIVSITKEEDGGVYLNLGLDEPADMGDGVLRVVKVKWKRMPDNSSSVGVVGGAR